MALVREWCELRVETGRETACKDVAGIEPVWKRAKSPKPKDEDS